MLFKIILDRFSTISSVLESSNRNLILTGISYMISPFNFHFVLLTALTLHMNQLFELSSGESKERTRKCYVITAMNNKIISNPDCLEFYSFIMCCKFQTPPPRSVVHSLNHVSFWRIETNFLWMHYEPKIKPLRKMHWKMNESPTLHASNFSSNRSTSSPIERHT